MNTACYFIFFDLLQEIKPAAASFVLEENNAHTLQRFTEDTEN